MICLLSNNNKKDIPLLAYTINTSLYSSHPYDVHSTHVNKAPVAVLNMFLFCFTFWFHVMFSNSSTHISKHKIDSVQVGTQTMCCVLKALMCSPLRMEKHDKIIFF